MIEVVTQGPTHAVIRRKPVTDSLGISQMMISDADAWLRFMEYLHSRGLRLIISPNSPDHNTDVLVCEKLEPGSWL